MRKLWGVLVVCMLASPALAESDADRLFSEGRALLAKNDPKGACEKFEAAIKIDPDAAGTMLNLGLCNENLKRYATSIEWFRRAQARAAESSLAEYEEAAKKYTVNIAPKVPTLKIELNGPTNSEIRIDGKQVQPSAYAQVEVDPGEHVVTGQAPGKETVSQTIEVKEGVKGTVVKIAILRDAKTDDDPGKPRKRLAYIVGAGGLVLYGVTLAQGLYFRNIQEEANGKMPRDLEAYDDADKKLKYMTTSFFIAGTAAVATAAILYLTAPSKESAQPRSTAFAPYLSGDQAGFAVSGSF
ncbi:MAG: tetratricopeptide repeat protein [Kofleriaceae bacterium]|nr:tetratricopeptide repeat protein [Kofleriaceae bacterium]